MLGKSDYARYPFTKEAAEFIKSKGVSVKDLALEDYSKIVSRAEGRIKEAIEDGIISSDWKNVDVEIFSFPVALMFIAALDSKPITRRAAFAESKRAYYLMRQEEREGKLVSIAKTFGWDIAPIEHPRYDLTLHLTDYLRSTSLLYEDRWKLINRLVGGGNVYITFGEGARLLQEEVRKEVEKKITENEGIKLPKELGGVLERLQGLVVPYERGGAGEKLPRVTIDAFPPCAKRLYELMAAGQHIPHIGRFMITSFLLGVGMSIEEVVKLFVSLTDFDERMTRYQVEHIAGRRGSGTKYSPPSCGTLRTHNLCPGGDEICSKIRHPIQYCRVRLGKKRRKK